MAENQLRTPARRAPRRNQTSEGPQPALGGGTYVLVSLVMLGIAVTIAVFLLKNPSATNGDALDLVYFGTTLALGLSASSFLFGAMRSYARYTGRSSLGTIELGGPVVVAALVITGFFYLRHISRPFDVLVSVFAAKHGSDFGDLLAEGTIATTLVENPIKLNRDGTAVLWGLSPSLRGTATKITATVPGYLQKSPDDFFDLKQGGKLKIEMERDPGDDVPELFLKQIAEIVLKNTRHSLDERETRNLSDQIVHAVELIHPSWTYWANSENGLESKITLAPLEDMRKSCRLIDWRIKKGGAMAAMAFRACKDDIHWSFTVTPVVTQPDAGLELNKPENTSPRESATAPTVVILQLVNKTKEEVSVYWDAGNGTLIKYSAIKVGGAYSVQTYAGHRWKVRGESGHEYLDFTPDSSTKIASLDVVQN